MYFPSTASLKRSSLSKVAWEGPRCSPLTLPVRKSRPGEIVRGPVTTLSSRLWGAKLPRCEFGEHEQVTDESARHLLGEECGPCRKGWGALGIKSTCPGSLLPSLGILSKVLPVPAPLFLHPCGLTYWCLKSLSSQTWCSCLSLEGQVQNDSGLCSSVQGRDPTNLSALMVSMTAVVVWWHFE